MQAKSLRIDALRGAAILGVIEYHYGMGFGLYAWLDLPPFAQKILGYGWVGVDLFFVLSAFLLTRNLLRNQNQDDAIRSFYLRRIFRILPLYSVMLASAALLWLWWRPDRGGPGGWLLDGMAPSWIYVLFLQNIWIGLQTTWSGHFLSPTWSLAIEEHFYLILPLLILYSPSRIILILSLSMVALAPSIRLALYDSFGGFTAGVWTIARIDSLGWGVLAAMAAQGCEITPKEFRSIWIFGAGAAVMAIAGLGLAQSAELLNSTHVMSNSLIYTITALVAARFVAGVASDDRLALARSGNIALSALAWAGSRCYSLYLLHMPIAGLTALAFGRQTLGVDSAEGAAMLACAILVLFVVAESSYRMIERPFMSMGETISSSKRERAARAALAK